MINRISNVSPHKAAIIAGLGFLILVIFGSFLFYFLNSTLEGGIPGESAVSASKHIINNVSLLGFFIFSLLIMIICNIVIALTLYIIIKPINNRVAFLASFIRFIYTIIFGLTMIILFTEPSLFSYIFLIGQIFYAVHMIILGYLVFKSDYIPKILGLLLIIGGTMGYLIEVLTYFIFQDYLWIASIGIIVAVITEIAFAIWLLIKADSISEMNTDVG